MIVTFVPSNVHQGHYIHIDGESTGEVVNYYAYLTMDNYRKEVDAKIQLLKQQYEKKPKEV